MERIGTMYEDSHLLELHYMQTLSLARDPFDSMSATLDCPYRDLLVSFSRSYSPSQPSLSMCASEIHQTEVTVTEEH